MTRRFVRLISVAGVLPAVVLTMSLAAKAYAAAKASPSSVRPPSKFQLSQPYDEPPDVRGLPLDIAIKRVQAGWYPGWSTVVEINQVPAGVDQQAVLVVDQKVTQYGNFDTTPFVLAVLLGVRLPDLTAQTLAVAAKAVSQLGLVPVPLPAGAGDTWLVLKQTPAPDELVPFGYRIQLAAERATLDGTTVPDLVGRMQDEAKTLVTEANLVFEPHVIKYGTAPCRVVSQQPRAGQTVEAATTVTADVDCTEPIPDVVVPNVVHQDETKARAAVEAANLVFDPKILKDGSGPGRVVRQFPPAGRKVPPATVVTVEIERSSSGVPPHPRAVVPDVIGQKETNARKAIETARLKFRSRVIRPGPGVGTVLNQRPLAGTKVDVGTAVTVDLTREQSPPLVTVPDLVDKSEEEARGAVEGVRLIFDPIGGRDTVGRARRVVRQFPPAGRPVPAGTTVSVELVAVEKKSQTGWWIGGLTVLALLGTASGAITHKIRSRRKPPPKPPRPPLVRAIPRPLAPPTTRLRESSPAHGIQVKPRMDRGRQYLQEEVHR